MASNSEDELTQPFVLENTNQKTNVLNDYYVVDGPEKEKGFSKQSNNPSQTTNQSDTTEPKDTSNTVPNVSKGTTSKYGQVNVTAQLRESHSVKCCPPVDCKEKIVSHVVIHG